MKAEILEWDSRFFNRKIGLLNLAQDIEIFSEVENFDLLYVKQKVNKFIEIKNFYLTHNETKVIFSKKILNNNLASSRFIFSGLDRGISKEQIYKLAFESGKYSRFKLDDNFTQHEFEALYKTWVDNSLRKEFADAILIYIENNLILGFITYKIVDDYAIIGLIGVSEKHQRKGIGRDLLVKVENELNIKQIKELRIPTQLQNKQACGFYTKLGFKIVEKIIIKHYWRK